MMKMTKAVVLLTGILVLVVVGCGEDKANHGSGSAPLPEETSQVSYTLAPTTKYISAENEAAVLSVDEDGAAIVLDGDSALAASIEEGDVLMFGITSQTPNGLLRKVTARTNQGADVALGTGQATIPEAFEKLDLKIERPITYDDMRTYETTLEGLEISRYPLSFEGSAGDTYEVDFNGTVVYDHDGNLNTTDDQVIADGSISFTLGLTLEVETKYFSLERVKMGAAVSQEADLTFSTTLPALEFDKEIVVADLYFGAFAVGPVVITPNLELLIGANGELQAQVSMNVTESMSVSAGAIYQNGSWVPYSDFSSNWDFQPPTLSASARVKAYTGPRLNLMIYGVAGPYVQVDGYVELEADVNKTPWWELYVGLEAFLGIKGEIPILGTTYKLFNYQSGDLLDYRERLAEAETDPPCVPDCSGWECGNGGCPDQPNECGTCIDGWACEEGECVCQPDCSGLDCGPDLICGESCGKCDDGWACVGGECKCQPDCAGLECGTDPVCGESCGICNDGWTCQAGGCICQPDCSGLDCGPDPVCSEPCGICNDGWACEWGQCVEQETCGNGECDAGEDSASCPQDCMCIPDCTGLDCGPDPACGISCGTCGDGQTCQAGECVGETCVPDCTGVVCGDGGCSDQPYACGSCGGDQPCIEFSPSTVDFGQVVRGDTKTLSVDLVNCSSSLALEVTEITFGQEFGMSPTDEFLWEPQPSLPMVVAANESATLYLSYSPKLAETDSGYFLFHNNDPTQSEAKLDVKGVGVPPPIDDIGLHIEVVWDQENADVDLHLVKPGGQLFDCNDDCYFANPQPDWGEEGSWADDPFLDGDDIDGYGPEVVNVSVPMVGSYMVAAYYFSDSFEGEVGGPTSAVISIYSYGDLVGEFGPVLLTDTGKTWEVCWVDWPLGEITEIGSVYDEPDTPFCLPW